MKISTNVYEFRSLPYLVSPRRKITRRSEQSVLSVDREDAGEIRRRNYFLRNDPDGGGEGAKIIQTVSAISRDPARITRNCTFAPTASPRPHRRSSRSIYLIRADAINRTNIMNRSTHQSRRYVVITSSYSLGGRSVFLHRHSLTREHLQVDRTAERNASNRDTDRRGATIHRFATRCTCDSAKRGDRSSRYSPTIVRRATALARRAATDSKLRDGNFAPMRRRTKRRRHAEPIAAPFGAYANNSRA